jgi:hypothetical protein
MDGIEDRWLQQNEQMRKAIVEAINPEVMALWLKKNHDYAGQQMFLGLKAQFCDINRKFWKLKSALWDDQALGFESAEEVCMDMIGHLMMTIYFLKHEQGTVDTLERCPAMAKGGHDYSILQDGRTMCRHCYKVRVLT